MRFLDELLALDTHNVLDESVVNAVQTVHSLGKDQYAKYYKEVTTDCTRSIHESIKKNHLPLFSCPQLTTKTKDLTQSDVALFSHLYIVMEHRHECILQSREPSFFPIIR